jgi:hypothetical protein
MVDWFMVFNAILHTDCKRQCMCVLKVSIFNFSTILKFDFGIFPSVVFFFHLISLLEFVLLLHLFY